MMLDNFKLCFFICAVCCVYKNTQAFMFRSPAEWAMQVVKVSLSDSPLLDEPEKGFDLDENDMRKFHVWPLGVIPYYIDDLSFGKALKDTIRLYLNNVNKVTGLRFTEIPRPPEDEKSRWVFFINRKGQLGCVDLSFNSFSNEGVQRIVLGYDCLATGRMGAIILSLIGVPPQHNAPDRNNFIEVVKENILPDKLYLFDILKDDQWLFFDVDYDSESASHYDPHQYTSNGGETIKFKTNNLNKVGTLTEHLTTGFTAQDIKKIKMLYNYMTRKRDTSIKVPGCDKLFAPGSNISNFQPNISDNIEPRRKPNRYNGNQSKIENENSPHSHQIQEDNTNSTESHQIQEDNMQIDLSQIPQDEKLLPQDKNIKLLLHKLSNKEKILQESDYETGEEKESHNK